MEKFLKCTETFKFVSGGFNELVECKPFDNDFASSGEYCVDDSHFVPMSEAVKQLGIGSSISVEPIYDFNDGVDNGMKLSAARRKGSMLAEISTELNEANDAIKASADAVALRDKEIASYQKGLESIGNSGE